MPHCRIADEKILPAWFHIVLEIHHRRRNARWHGRLGTLFRAMKMAHDVMPYRSGTRNSGYVLHAASTTIANPHAHGVALRPAHAPVVPHILAGPRLYRCPEKRRQRTVKTEGTGASLPIGQYIAHYPCRRRRHDLLPLG